MSSGCKLIGATERETLINQTKWLAGWSMSMIRAMRMMYSVMESIRRIHPYGSVGGTPTLMETNLDTINVMLDGPITEMRRRFDLDTVAKPDDELPIHLSLEKAMEELIAQANGKKPIPVDDKRRVWFDEEGKEFPNKEAKTVLEKNVYEICDLVQRIQVGLKNIFAGVDDRDKPHVKMSLDIVDGVGRPIVIPDVCDVEAVINQFHNKLLEEATKQLESQGSPEGGADAVQDQPSD